MSYIVPRDKPQGCSKCPYINQYNDCRLIWGSERIRTVEEQYQHCPLIEVPTPHGRLGDLDELKKKVLTWLPSDPCGQEEKEFPFETDICVSMLMEIEEAESIIEAEE